MECIFCKIANKEIEIDSVYEDELVIAFPDKNPVSNGHMLIIPKQHFKDIFEIPQEILERITVVLKEISLKIRKDFNATGVNLLNASGKDAQQSVFHFHFHVVPRYPDDGLDLWIHNRDLNKDEERS